MDVKTKLVVKSKTTSQLKAKQFPRLLKDLEKFNKKLLKEKTLKTTGLSADDYDMDVMSHYIESEANSELTEETEVEETNSGNEWFDSCVDVMAPETEQMTELIDGFGGHSSSGKKSANKSTKQTKSSRKQEELRQELREMDVKSKASSLRSSLKSYIHSCIYADFVSKAHSVLLYYRSKQLKAFTIGNRCEESNAIDVSVYNVLLKGWAQRGKTLRIKELLSLMKSANVKPNNESFAYYFLSLGRQTNPPTVQEVMSAVQQMATNDLNTQQVFDNCFINKEERNVILSLLNKSVPHLRPNAITFRKEYSCNLMKSIETSEQKPYNPCEDLDLSGLESAVEQQFGLEINGNIIIKSIVCDDLSDANDKRKKYLKNQWNKSEDEWRELLKEAFLRQIKTLQMQSNEIKGMTLYPYLAVLDTKYYIEAMIEEIRLCANMSEYYSPPMSALYSNLGKKLMLRYLVKTHIRDGTAQDFQELYNKYINYYKNPSMTTQYNSRQFWQKAMTDNQHNYNNNIRYKVWPFHIQVGVGHFLYDLIIQETKIDANIMNSKIAVKRKVPAFGISYKPIGNLKYQKEFRAHPTITKLFRRVCLDSLVFDINMLPMLCPPTPWVSPRFGGYLLCKTDFVRMPDTYQKWIYNTYDNQKLYPVFDSLNYLSMCPWILNSRVLDVATHIFRNKGDLNLSIPKPITEFPPLPKVEQSMSRSDKIQRFRQRFQQKREMAEMYSLWCDCLYKLSIANHFRNKIFWFPNNIDFRGRVYPVPPHFNHLGNDLTRSLMLFAKGQPLGEDGLDWLKIHLINLTGLKKRSSMAERLAFANEIMPLIIDSADNPLDGCKWWMQSDEPWQTLASCVEIVNAIRSPDPTQYISHFPVHQDGSCNGLQHYAALGRDQIGAESVNLHPADRPQDVYSDVAALVEKQRARDAMDGHEVGKLLDGYVGRKIVKQTVMTYVYGVTRFGAKLQIYKRLKEIDKFPKERAFSSAIYLTQKTFLSIQEMFTETRCIQDWLTDCARQISRVYEKPVEWITPLEFPVIQPYHKSKAKIGETFLGIGSETNLKYLCRSDAFQKPNSLKQKNAFPPNFIHSLDSSHMMLTALRCHREGLTYASVHDCFWTHANCVHLMNRFCREQFVSLHNEPILDDLAHHFIRIYGSMPSNASKADVNKTLELLGKRLTKGDFVLENVLNSVYFFS
ncbi:unnamed protein product [Medioppia subpectinata]|uniref:DNA-directed RNA polymerase n=1 Tax=Medioppia subpectinata TaxID=1979941 RepID=A0A7R9KLF3_9ACAR|nr:unnamed protein product [Medioppia subpectinata]CAG2104639.1 unnamed protein product [Medioppia subpectinata]